MSDQDELRDRIAKVLFDRDQVTLERRGFFKLKWDDDIGNRDEYLKPWRDEAQAIIDEFGLTTETAVDMSTRTTDKRTGNVRYGEKTRIVGKWEKQ